MNWLFGGDVSKREGFRKATIIFLAELVGTASLLYLGCMGCEPRVYGATSFSVPQMPPLIFAFVIVLIVQMFGHVSGAHLNPAVTIAAAIMGEIKICMVPIYLVAEFLGAFFGYAILKVSLPSKYLDSYTNPGLCSTVPSGDISSWQAFLIEFIITGFLIMSLCSFWDKKNEKNTDCLSLRIGFLLAGVFIVAAPYTGASLNTARTFAPAVFNQDWDSHWVYWVAPNLSAIFFSYFYWFFFMHLHHKNDPVEESIESKQTGQMTD